MDLAEKIEELIIENHIKDFVMILTKKYNNALYNDEKMLIIRQKMDLFLKNLPNKFIYDFDIYTEYNRISCDFNIRFKFNIRRRKKDGFLGQRTRYRYSK